MAPELRIDDRQRLVGERRVQQLLDGALQVARDTGIVGVDAGAPAGERALDEERVPLARGRPQHPPVAHAVGDRLAAVVRQADERVLSGHDDVVRVDHLRLGHGLLLLVRQITS